MNDIKDTIAALKELKWKHVLILLAIVVIMLVAAGGVSYIYATKGATDAVSTQLELQQKIHDYEMNMRMQN